MDPKKMSPEELEQFIHRELRALPSRKAPAGFESRLQAKLGAQATRQAFSPERVEQLVHRELTALPLRRAPRTLESRVLAEIERRASVAWYHRSWSYWPAAVKSAFLALGTAVSGAAVLAFYFMGEETDTGALTAAAGERFSGVMALFRIARWMVSYTSDTFASIPPLWLYGSLAVIGFLYATFFGLGAAAYRTLYRNH